MEAYHSAFAFASKPEYFDQVVTRAEYLESGSNASRRKFKDWKAEEKDKDKAKEMLKGKGRHREDDKVPVAPKKLSRTRTRTSLSNIARRP
jgi:actin-related protein 6